jgi:hypothetical protein
MARCPFATWVPVTLRASQKKIKPAGLVCHTAVSNSALLKPSGEVRWHFYLDRDGHLYQFFDTTVSAACQRDGNYWTSGGEGRGFLSCESWDGAYSSVWPNPNKTDTIPPWTGKQMATWARLGAWLHDTHSIPLIKATGVRGQGIGYHSQFTAPDGTLRWNKSHACPAKARIAQMPTVIRMMNDALEGDDMFSDADRDKLEFLFNNMGRIGSLREKDSKGNQVFHAAGYYHAHTDRNAFDVKAILQQKVLPELTAEKQRDVAEALVLSALQAAVAELRDGMDGDLSDTDVQKLSQALLRGLVGEVSS